MTSVLLPAPGGVLISTHTLTWSVTIYSKPNAVDLQISTHTLTWSVTATERKHAVLV